jgi:hypothetical protein
MRTQNLDALRERIRQVKLELARLKMLEKLALMESRASRRQAVNHARRYPRHLPPHEGFPPFSVRPLIRKKTRGPYIGMRSRISASRIFLTHAEGVTAEQ